jgi:hypothetical protein
VCVFCVLVLLTHLFHGVLLDQHRLFRLDHTVPCLLALSAAGLLVTATPALQMVHLRFGRRCFGLLRWTLRHFERT